MSEPSDSEKADRKPPQVVEGMPSIPPKFTAGGRVPEELLQGNEGTRIDLGDDLIEKTAVFEGMERETQPPLQGRVAPVRPQNKVRLSLSTEPVRSSDEILDRLESARILEAEGLLDQAKSALRSILVFDRSHTGAAAQLSRIHDQELRELLVPSDREGIPSRSRGLSRSLVPLPAGRLEGKEEFGEGRGSALSSEGMKGLLDSVRQLDENQRMDFAVSLIVMGLNSAACELLEGLFSSVTQGPFARVLWGQASFESGEVLKAELHLTGLLNDTDIIDLNRLDAVYWLARSKVQRGLREEGLALLKAIRTSDLHFRDVDLWISEIESSLKEQRRKEAREKHWKAEQEDQ